MDWLKVGAVGLVPGRTVRFGERVGDVPRVVRWSTVERRHVKRIDRARGGDAPRASPPPPRPEGPLTPGCAALRTTRTSGQRGAVRGAPEPPPYWGRPGTEAPAPPPGRRLVFCIYLVDLVYIFV